MSDGEIAFDDWEEAAQQVEQQQQEAQQQQTTHQHQQQQSKTQGLKAEDSQHKQAAKLTLKQRLQEYKALSAEDFQAKYADISQSGRNVMKTSLSSILKDDKDFKGFARVVAARLGKDIPEDQADDNLAMFFEEMILYMYNGLENETLFELKKKIKVLKNSRKEQEKKKKKLKMKQQRQRKNEKEDEHQTSTSLNTKQVQQDSLFEGAADLNSKQVDEERKNHARQKQEEPEKRVAAQSDEDSDQFM